MHQEDERDHFECALGREHSQPVLAGGDQQEQRGGCGTDHRSGEALRGDQGGLLEARLHRDDRRDRHPVAVREVQSERQRGGASNGQSTDHRKRDQRPGQSPRGRVTGKLGDRLRQVPAAADQPRGKRDRDPQRRPPGPGGHLGPGVAGDAGVLMQAEREPQGDDEPDVEQQGRDESAHPERDREAGRQRHRESREHQPAPGVPADAEPKPGQAGADQREHGDARHAVRIAAARVGQPREQRAEHGAEQILLVPDRPEQDQRHERDVQEHHCSRPVEPPGLDLEHVRQPAHDHPPGNRPRPPTACHRPTPSAGPRHDLSSEWGLT
ncbi:MAG TPA: hypothetical protein VMC03_00900 [Streptosporangiaceae bacterium]|nr:hypothetical protein [Streptosporangiaceae bacterium]